MNLDPSERDDVSFKSDPWNTKLLAILLNTLAKKIEYKYYFKTKIKSPQIAYDFYTWITCNYPKWQLEEQILRRQEKLEQKTYYYGNPTK